MSGYSSMYLTMALSQIAWVFLGGLILVGAILLFRADRKHHTLCLLIGSVVQLFVSLLSLILFGPWAESFAALDGNAISRHERLITTHTAMNLFSQGLIAYGFVMVGLIQFRKSRMPEFRDESAT